MVTMNEATDELPAPDQPTPGDMGLFEHLSELRRRLLFSFIGILTDAIACFLGATELFDILTHPFYIAFADYHLIGTGPAEAFLLKLKASIFSGVILVSPFLFVQLWLFMSPGLYEHERKMAVPFVICTSVLFGTGVWFAYSIVVPYAFDFFQGEYASLNIRPEIRISEYLSITIKILLGFGLIFETPIIAFFLGRLGIIDDAFLIRYYRHAIVGMFVIAAFLTPPDVVTQFLMAGPLILLYGVSILIVRYTGKKTEDDLSDPPA